MFFPHSVEHADQDEAENQVLQHFNKHFNKPQTKSAWYLYIKNNIMKFVIVVQEDLNQFIYALIFFLFNPDVENQCKCEKRANSISIFFIKMFCQKIFKYSVRFSEPLH